MPAQTQPAPRSSSFLKQQHNPEVSEGAAPAPHTQGTAGHPKQPPLAANKGKGTRQFGNAAQVLGSSPQVPSMRPQSSGGCWSGGDAPGAAPSLPALPPCSASPHPGCSQIVCTSSQMVVGWGWLLSGCFSRLTAPREGAQSPPVGAQPPQRLCPAPSLCLSQTWRHHGGVSKIYFTQRVGGKQGRKTSRSPRHVYRRGGTGTDTHRHLCAHPAWVLPPLATHGGFKKSTAPLPSPPAPAAPPV